MNALTELMLFLFFNTENTVYVTNTGRCSEKQNLLDIKHKMQLNNYCHYKTSFIECIMLDICTLKGFIMF